MASNQGARRPRHRIISGVSRLRRHLLSLLLAALAAGCAGVEGVSKLSTAARIGVISAIGDDFTLTKAGFTGTDGSSRHASIEAWGIDDLVVARIGAALAPRFQIQPVTYPRAAFVAPDPTSPFRAARLLDSRDNRIAELVRTQVTPQGLDAYVVVTKAAASYGSRSGQVTGLGVIQHVAIFGSSAQLHALYTVTVVDGHTLNVIGKRTAAPSGEAELFRLAGPSREIGADLLSAADNPAVSDQLKAAIVELIDLSLGKTLQDLHLLGKSAS
jgi:hypothetical protein